MNIFKKFLNKIKKPFNNDDLFAKFAKYDKYSDAELEEIETKEQNEIPIQNIAGRQVQQIGWELRALYARQLEIR